MLLFLLLLLTACSSNEPEAKRIEQISGRETPALYRIEVPLHWQRIEISNVSDTKNALAEFRLQEIRVTIHNFPGTKIPPQAQVERWKNQFPSQNYLTPQAFSGFQGLLLEAGGQMHGASTKVLAWALELPPVHQRMVRNTEKAADISIKATGPAALIEKYHDEIYTTARTFELIDEIPQD